MKWRNIIITIVVLGAAGATTWWALQPQPMGVDLATIKRGNLIEIISDEGVVKIKDTYQISTPIGGDVKRIPFKVGDFVEQGKIVATITPQKSAFLDERSLLEAQASVKTSEAALNAAKTAIDSAKSELSYWQNEVIRVEKLLERGLITEQAAEQARLQLKRATSNLKSAKSNLELQQHQLEQAKAHLIEPNGVGYNPTKYNIKAPISGQILEIANESSRSLPAGSHLLTIGNPQNLEVVVELLSSDAVRIKKGANATISNWGKSDILKAKVTLIEPIGFTKISALGIEEQRVNVHLEILSDPKIWSELGHLYRVFVSIEAQRADDVVLVPNSALFRNNDKWSVFIDEEGLAKLRHLDLGLQNSQYAQALNNIKSGEKVILHPSDNIGDGTMCPGPKYPYVSFHKVNIVGVLLIQSSLTDM